MSSGNGSNNPYKERNWLRVIRNMYNLKILQVLLILSILAILFYFLDYATSIYTQGFWIQLKKWPLRSLADACLTAMLVGITYEWIVRKESEAELVELISNQLKTQNTTIIEEIPRALLITPEVVTTVLKKERLDDVIRSSIQITLGDYQMGNDIYEGFLKKTLSYTERWSNYRYKTTLSTISDLSLPEIVRNKFYETTIDLRYETKLTRNKFLFRCVDNIDDYDRSIRDPEIEFTWIFPYAPEFPSIDTNVFDVKRILVNDLELNIERANESNGNLIIRCTHPDLYKLEGQIVTIYYRYVTKMNKRGHLFISNVIKPTKNVLIQFDCSNTDIHYVNVIDFYVSTSVPKITYFPTKSRPNKIDVELSEWVFPKGGVAFIWVLSNEMNDNFLRPQSTKGKSVK